MLIYWERLTEKWKRSRPAKLPPRLGKCSKSGRMQKSWCFTRNASCKCYDRLRTAMLSRLPLPRLCRACRNDLLAVFDLVSGVSPKPRVFLLPSLKSSQQTNATRQFSHSRPCRTDVHNTDPTPTTPK